MDTLLLAFIVCVSAGSNPGPPWRRKRGCARFAVVLPKAGCRQPALGPRVGLPKPVPWDVGSPPAEQCPPDRKGSPQRRLRSSGLRGRPSLLILSSLSLGREGRGLASCLDRLSSMASRTLNLCPHVKTQNKSIENRKEAQRAKDQPSNMSAAGIRWFPAIVGGGDMCPPERHVRV